MDIGTLSTAMSGASIATSVNISLLKMEQENMKLVGQRLSQMIADTDSIIDIRI